MPVISTGGSTIDGNRMLPSLKYSANVDLDLP
jgi:hypothetical protein